MTKEREFAFEFLKVAYEKAAERYNNIYQSVWTIFSYMSAVSAGLIAFGADRLSNEGLTVLASVPLIFWFWSSYLPLDRYGNKTLVKLKDIEGKAKSEFSCDIDYFTDFAHSDHRIRGTFKDFRRTKSFWESFGASVSRARFAIISFFIVLHCLFFYSLRLSYFSGFYRTPEPPVTHRIHVTGNLSPQITVEPMTPQISNPITTIAPGNSTSTRPSVGKAPSKTPPARKKNDL